MQVGIRQRGERSGDAKCLLEAGFLDSLGVAKVQARATEDGVSAQRQKCHGSARTDFAAKAAVVDVANARQDRQPPPHDGLLRKQIVVKAQPVGGGDSKVRIVVYVPVLVFKVVTQRGLRPWPRTVDSLVGEAGEVVLGHAVESTVEWAVEIVDGVHVKRDVVVLEAAELVVAGARLAA